jgi:hypothetical protein
VSEEKEVAGCFKMPVPVEVYSVMPHGTVMQVPPPPPPRIVMRNRKNKHMFNTRRLAAWEAGMCCALARGRVAEVGISRRSSCGNYRIVANCKETRCEFRFEALFICRSGTEYMAAWLVQR